MVGKIKFLPTLILRGKKYSWVNPKICPSKIFFYAHYIWKILEITSFSFFFFARKSKFFPKKIYISTQGEDFNLFFLGFGGSKKKNLVGQKKFPHRGEKKIWKRTPEDHYSYRKLMSTRYSIHDTFFTITKYMRLDKVNSMFFGSSIYALETMLNNFKQIK